MSQHKLLPVLVADAERPSKMPATAIRPSVVHAEEEAEEVHSGRSKKRKLAVKLTSRLEAEIELSISLPRGKQGTNVWQFGRVEQWKALPGGMSFPVHHIRGHRCPTIIPARADTSLFMKVIRTLKYSKGQWTQNTSADVDNWSRAQRACHRAFTEQVYNSSVRNFMDVLLKHYLEDNHLDIVNIGCRSKFNTLLHMLRIVYVYYPDESDGSTLSEKYGVTRTPIVDNLVWDSRSKRTNLIVSVKHGTIRSEHEEQLKHKLLSMLPTETASSVKQRVCGVLICHSEVLFYLAEKSAKKINIFQLDSFDLTSEEDFSPFINYMIALFKYSQQVV